MNELLTHATAWMNFKSISWVKEASLKRLHTVWFHLYDNSACQRLRQDSQELEVWYKGIEWGSFGDNGKVLNPGCGGGYMDLHIG